MKKKKNTQTYTFEKSSELDRIVDSSPLVYSVFFTENFSRKSKIIRFRWL